MKVARAKGAAADGDALGQQRLSALPQNQFRGTAADIDDQSLALGAGHRMGHAGVHQPGFFMPGNHINAKTQVPFRAGQKQLRIVSFAHRTGGHRPHTTGLEATQFFAKSRERLPSTIQRHFVQRAALKPLRQPNGLTQGLHFLDHQLLVPPDRLADHQTKRVGAQVNGRKQGGVSFH